MSIELPGPFEGLPCWRGDALPEDDWTTRLNAAEGGELAAVSAALESGVEPPITPALRARFASLRAALESGRGIVLLRGVEVSGAGPEAEREAALFSWIGGQVGTPVSQAASGARIFRVRDEGFRIGQPQARGPNTGKGLSFHTDRCDVIAFLCVRQAAEGGESFLASSAYVYNRIRARRPDLLRVLMEPFYYQRHNIDHGNEWPFCAQPIFAVHKGKLICNILRVLIDRAYASDALPDMRPEQREALDLVQSIAAEEGVHRRFRLKPGDILMVNNFAALHSRSAFSDPPGSEGRLLLRLWLSVPNSRELPEAFAAHYGQVGAGALRGGIHAPGSGR